MKRIAKLITALQALILAPLGAAKAGDTTPSENLTFLSETAVWEEAFERIVQSEVEAAQFEASAAGAVQLGETRPERLEQNFDLGGKKIHSLNEDSRGLGLY